MDGTLVDSLAGIVAAVNEVRAIMGLEPIDRSEVRSYMGVALPEFIARFTTRCVDSPPANGAVDRAVRLYPMIYRQMAAIAVQPYEGVFDVLQYLRDLGIGLAVCTNKATDLAKVTLAGCGLHQYFRAEHVLGADALPKCKPDPTPLLALMDAFGVPPQETWMIGDSDSDMQAAHAAKCTAIACGYGYGEATAHGPAAVISKPVELIPLVVIRLGLTQTAMMQHNTN